MTPGLARELGLPDTRGVVVWRIHQDSAAGRAGMEPGDVIVSFDGMPVEHFSDYARHLSDSAAGATVTLGVIRRGEPLSFELEVSQAEAGR